MVRCTVLTLILGVVLILSGHIVDGKRRRHTSKALECPQTQDLLTPDICGASQLDGTPYEPGSGRGVVQPCWAPPQYTDLQRTELCDNATAITALTPNGAVIIKRCTHVYNLWRMHMTPNPYHQRIPLSSACLVLKAQGEVIKNDTSTCQTLNTTCTWGPFAVAAGDTSEVAENETEYQPMTGYMCCGADGPRGRSKTRDRGDKRNSRKKKNKRGKGRKTRRRNGERRNGRKRGDKKKNRVAKKGNSGRVSRRKGRNKKEGDDEKHGNSVSTTGEEEGDNQDTGTASSKKVEGRRSKNRNGKGKNGRGGKARKRNQGGRKSRGKSNRGKDRKQHRNSRKRNRKGSRGGRGQGNKEAPEEEEATDEEAVDDEYIYQEDNDGTDMGA